MNTMTLRGIDDETSSALKRKAQQEGTSVNALTVHLLRQSLGLEKRRRTVSHHDLDHLAGTWSEADAEAFANTTAVFEKVDEELWK